MTVLKSKNFILRPYKKGDEKSLIDNINEMDIYNHTLNIPFPYGPIQARIWISHCKKGSKTEINFAIDLDGEVVGGIGISKITKHKAEIGYWIGKKYRNMGIMTQAVGLVTSFGFKKLKLSRIYAHIFSKNKVSMVVLEKNNYTREGLMKKYYLKNGNLLNTISYAKVK